MTIGCQTNGNFLSCRLEMGGGWQWVGYLKGGRWSLRLSTIASTRTTSFSCFINKKLVCKEYPHCGRRRRHWSSVKQEEVLFLHASILLYFIILFLFWCSFLFFPSAVLHKGLMRLFKHNAHQSPHHSLHTLSKPFLCHEEEEEVFPLFLVVFSPCVAFILCILWSQQ